MTTLSKATGGGGATKNLSNLFSNIVAQARFTAEEGSLMTGLVKTYNIGTVAGHTVQIPKYGTVTAADVAEETDLSATALQSTNVDVEIKTVGAMVDVTDRAQMASADVVADIGTVLGNAIAKKIDSDILALLDDFSNVVGSQRAGVTLADLLSGVAKIRANSYRGELACVLHPEQAYHLKSQLTHNANAIASDIANEAMRTGYIGTIAGCNVYESADVVTDTDLGTSGAVGGTGAEEDLTYAKGAIFAPEAIAMALKRDFVIEQERNASKRSTELVATAYYGVAELEDGFGVTVKGLAQ